MQHQFRTREDCDCCGDINCWVCEGGLFICKVCGLMEGSLTTDCPGVSSYPDHAQEVYQGLEDFVDGRWVPRTSPHSPKHKVSA